MVAIESEGAMQRLILAMIAVSALSGCGAVNHSIGSLQFNDAVEPLPHNYRQIALDLVQDRTAGRGQAIGVSEPAVTVGQTADAPQRWYVCLTGIEPTAAPPRPGQIPIGTHLDRWFRGSDDSNRYDVAVIFQERGPNIVVEGFNPRLCRTS